MPTSKRQFTFEASRRKLQPEPVTFKWQQIMRKALIWYLLFLLMLLFR